MRQQLRPALVILGLLTLITGVLYPLVITAVAQVVFPDQANGSLIVREGQIIGSELIGQSFDDPHYFWGRPSATNPAPYNAAASSGSNDGPLSPALTARVQDRIDALRAADPGLTGPIPVDLVTASGSGLDPQLSPAAAFVQVPRVARARGMDEAVVRNLVAEHVENRQFGLLGEPRVNVLKLNLALDDLTP
ncbi:MAG: potassium-transporting ATPase subunit KdpC [Chloroflexi bacterium]|nr:potassium-transporting ATPase subunit KdpC [Chloroflexota bacterium]